MAEVKPDIETFAKIKVVGVGGSGVNAVNRMIASKIRGVEFIAMNTDVQQLHNSHAPVKLHIGKAVTRGLGAGMNPEVGARAAEESQNEIRDILKGADMVFITCGLGGGTGSGVAPLVSQIAKDCGALTVAVVTKPFAFEGAQRRDIAEKAHDRLTERVDTIITIPNDRVLQIIDKKTSLVDSFKIVDDVLRQGVQGISELITIPGLVNVDFADVKAIMDNQGSALMGIGKASGENRAAEAAKAAIASPLLDLSIDGARGVLFTVTGSSNLSMHELTEAAKVITGSVDANAKAKVIFGAVIDDQMKDEVRITVIATGFSDKARPSASAKSAFASGSYTASPFLKSKEREMEAARPEFHPQQLGERPFTSRALPADPPDIPGGSAAAPLARPARVAAPLSGASDEEDLEIPAFIRKKML